MAIIDISETVNGASTTGNDPSLSFLMGSPLYGNNTISGQVALVFLSSGLALGIGSLIDGTLFLLQGTLTGSSNVTLGPGVNTKIFKGSILPNIGSLVESVPLPIVGVGVLSGYYEIVSYPPPACCNCECNQLTLPYGAELQPKTLFAKLCDGYGNPFKPANIWFNVYFIQNGLKRRVGAPNRTPSYDHTDQKYYVPSIDFDCSQPGNWIVTWCYQVNLGGPVMCAEQTFRVVDNAHKCPPDNLPRKCKIGWDILNTLFSQVSDKET